MNVVSKVVSLGQLKCLIQIHIFFCVITGSALFRNVSNLRRTFRTRIPLVESIHHHNMGQIMKDIVPRKKRCVRLTNEETKQWNWFIHQSTTTSNRGVLFNIQMATYLQKIMAMNKDLNDAYQLRFYCEG